MCKTFWKLNHFLVVVKIVLPSEEFTSRLIADFTITQSVKNVMFCNSPPGFGHRRAEII